MVYSAIAHGAKGVIYFTYNSFVDIARDPVQGLAALHPDALNLQLEISRISTELHTLAPLISISDVLPYSPEHYVYTNRGCIQCFQILSGRENLVLIITNRNYLYTRRDFHSFPIKDVEIRIKPPRWLKPQLSFLISHEGMTTLKMYREDVLLAAGAKKKGGAVYEAFFAEEVKWLPQAKAMVPLALKNLAAGKLADINKMIPLYLYPDDCQVRR